MPSFTSKEFSRKIVKEIFTLLLISFVILSIVLIILSIVGYNSESLRTQKLVLDDSALQLELRKKEILFREEILSNISEFYSNKDFRLLDSVKFDKHEITNLKCYLAISKLKEASPEKSFKFKVSKIRSDESPAVYVDSLKSNFSIDFSSLEKILKSGKSSDSIEDSVKYGNFVITKYKLYKKLDYQLISISIFLIIAFLVFAIFFKRIGISKKYGVDRVIENISSDKNKIEEAKKILDKNEISKEELKKLKDLVSAIEGNLESYDFDNVLKSIMYDDVVKSEKRANELYNRSTFMLILGLLIAVLGVVVFYISLPDYKELPNENRYLMFAIRPTLILIFIQSIAFYILKQYRSLINDYKYFYSEYLKKSKLYTSYLLIKNDDLGESKLMDSLLLNVEGKYVVESNDESKDNNHFLIEIIKVLFDKLK